MMEPLSIKEGIIYHSLHRVANSKQITATSFRIIATDTICIFSLTNYLLLKCGKVIIFYYATSYIHICSPKQI